MRSIDEKERNVTPKFKPLARQIFAGNLGLALQNFLVIWKLRILFQKLLIFIESLFVVAQALETPTGQVRGLRHEIGIGPNPRHSARRFQSKAICLLVERGLGNCELVLRPVHLPFAVATDRFVAPTFARPVNERRRGTEWVQQQESCQNEKARGPTMHVGTVATGRVMPSANIAPFGARFLSRSTSPRSMIGGRFQEPPCARTCGG